METIPKKRPKRHGIRSFQHGLIMTSKTDYDPAQKRLHLMIGFPMSGKSTLAKEMGFPIVSPDSIRTALHGRSFVSEAEGMVWTIARYIVNALFLAGHDDVILDACNATRKRRDQWKSNKYVRQFHVMPATRGECILRLELCNLVPELESGIRAAIERMDHEFEYPKLDEIE
jgi:hypothetical protein